ncbi:hypothetical protein [Limnoraphis robusta]|uniref:Uncharacterized protein n=1 Tax=Limnoraphis robusta CCNP1315 TaxID=3110306 RepID=A0ABU5U0G0_9CYAN|nr:hypothetical protein [Limnoraphis robusta]MEA5499095.1 hypothetical protein [Limnoraphis robusta BA-68 BA1]MEA5520681.1 hypothetical protein [Limnoraphis robusta CCNP1315]MEA5545338.1 hypothetical protein [Limnoraphis robusta CCNP1324]
MLAFDACPSLENTLERLINKTEKNWGYLQIYKRTDFYAINILGKTENILKFKSSESTHSYRLFWYKRPEPSVFVQSKTTKTYNRLTRTYDKSKSYQVCFKQEANAIESSINQRFADLVKKKILLSYESGNAPAIAIVRQ